MLALQQAKVAKVFNILAGSNLIGVFMKILKKLVMSFGLTALLFLVMTVVMLVAGAGDSGHGIYLD